MVGYLGLSVPVCKATQRDCLQEEKLTQNSQGFAIWNSNQHEEQPSSSPHNNRIQSSNLNNSL